jgi:hypothetical protein
MKYPWHNFLRKIAVPQVPEGVDYTGVFAVADNTPWWLAIHQVLDEAEKETIVSSRNRTGNPNLCIADVGAGEGIDLVRQKLIDKRRLALQHASNQPSATRAS